MQKTITRFTLCLLGLVGLTLFAFPVTAQVFDSGPSDSALFDTVINMPPGPNIGNFQSLGGDGSTHQRNISNGSVGRHFDANSGSEINVSGGLIRDFFDANSDSEVNISGGSVGDGFRAFSDSEVNISGGTIGDNFHAFGNSKINLRGTEFVLDGVPLDDSLTIDDAFTIDDRDVILSGRLADGTTFSFAINTVFPPNVGEHFFHPNATLTVTLSPLPTTHVPLFTFDGDSAGDGFGRSVSGAGDVNGDGIDDLIVGAPSDANNGAASGSARVLSGVDGGVLYTFAGDSQFDQLGSSVSGAGDVDGDGFADLIVRTGNIARVFSGIDGGTLYNFNDDVNSVSDAGDVNGDGFDDLILGAGNIARVLSGSDGSVLYDFEGAAAFADRFGRSVGGVGDVNGDGFDDLFVEGVNQNRAHVFSGSNGDVLYNFSFSLPTGIGSIDLSLSGAGDVDGDGFPDLIVGSVERNEFQDLVGGRARVFSGANGRVLYDFDGDSRDDRFGISVSGAGDVNGDGFDDLIVGAPGDEDNTGSVRLFSGSDGSVLNNFFGESAGDGFGGSVSGVGDVNGDGLADFIVGAGSGGGANNGGYARLFVSQIPVTILGDCDLNGVVNFLDINPFIGLLASNTFLEQADCNQDGVLDFLDINPFIAILSGN